MKELKAVDEKTLFYAWSDACKESKLSMFLTLPNLDGRIITKESFNKSTIPDIPLIVGVTATDMMQPALGWLASKYTKKANNDSSPCYLYHFDRLLPGDDKGAWHSCDLLYAFGTLGISWRPFEDVDRRISEQMIDAFSTFVKTGNPNCASVSGWEPGETLILK